MYYYKNGLSTFESGIKLKTIEELKQSGETDETAQNSVSYIGDWQECTEQEYNEIKNRLKAIQDGNRQHFTNVFTLKKQLEKTDYVALKLAEAQTIYTVTGDNTMLNEVYEQYKDVLVERSRLRELINQEELKS